MLFRSNDTATTEIYTTEVTLSLHDALPISLHLGLMALTLAIVVGVSLGVLAAVNQNGLFDYICTFIAMLGVAIPNFVMAIVFIIVFVMGLKLIPYTGGWEDPVDWIMPTIVLSNGGVCGGSPPSTAASIPCPQCRGAMWLVALEPRIKFKNLDVRSFACDCGDTASDVIRRE